MHTHGAEAIVHVFNDQSNRRLPELKAVSLVNVVINDHVVQLF